MFLFMLELIWKVHFIELCLWVLKYEYVLISKDPMLDNFNELTGDHNQGTCLAYYVFLVHVCYHFIIPSFLCFIIKQLSSII